MIDPVLNLNEDEIDTQVEERNEEEMKKKFFLHQEEEEEEIDIEILEKGGVISIQSLKQDILQQPEEKIEKFQFEEKPVDPLPNLTHFQFSPMKIIDKKNENLNEIQVENMIPQIEANSQQLSPELDFGVIEGNNDDDNELHIDKENEVPNEKTSPSTKFNHNNFTPHPPPSPIHNQPSKVIVKNWRLKFTPAKNKYPLNIGIEGNRIENMDKVYYSSTIETRLNHHEVQTGNKTIIQLEGKMDIDSCKSRGFPVKVIEAFRDGFPLQWKQILKEDLPKDQDTSTSSSKGRSHEDLNENFEQVSKKKKNN